MSCLSPIRCGDTLPTIGDRLMIENLQTHDRPWIASELVRRFGEDRLLAMQPTKDDTPTIWLDKGHLRETLGYLKSDLSQPYRMLFDLSATDERLRRHHDGLPLGSFTVFYQLYSFERNEWLRLKVPLAGDDL